MTGRGDPLAEMLAELGEHDLERTAKAISACHRRMAGRARERGETKLAEYHRLLAGDAFRRLREVNS